MYNKKRGQASIKYNNANIKQIKIGLNIHYDKDIIDFLEKCDNKQGLIKSLLRQKIKEDLQNK